MWLGPWEGGPEGHEQRTRKQEGVVIVAEPKGSWKQAVSLKRQAGPARGQTPMPASESSLQEEKGLKNIRLHPY